MRSLTPSSITKRRSAATLLAIASALAVTPTSASAGEGVPSTYSHGAYDQIHFSTKAACDVDRRNAIDYVNTFNVANVDTGACHIIDAGAGASRKVGYVYDLAYTAERALFAGDVRIGSYSTTQLTNAHSFKLPGRYPSQAQAQAALNVAITNLGAWGAKVTWNSGVVFNAVSNTYDFEVDYNSRKPMYWAHTEISQLPNVTSPSLGVISPIPTTPPVDTGTGGVITPPNTTTPESNALGLDLSSHTIVNDWAGWKNAGYKFVIAKSTEGTNYISPSNATQVSGAKANGMFYGTYHFARPSQATGADQADYFLAHSTNIDSKDPKFINRWLDIEDNPSKTDGLGMCYGMTQYQMNHFINDFVNEIKAKTGQTPGIYTRTGWWNTCVGVSTLNSNAPLWLASWGSTMGKLPTTWTAENKQHLIWQNSANDAKGYDTNVFNGGLSALTAYGASSKS